MSVQANVTLQPLELLNPTNSDSESIKTIKRNLAAKRAEEYAKTSTTDNWQIAKGLITMIVGAALSAVASGFLYTYVQNFTIQTTSIIATCLVGTLVPSVYAIYGMNENISVINNAITAELNAKYTKLYGEQSQLPPPPHYQQQSQIQQYQAL